MQYSKGPAWFSNVPQGHWVSRLKVLKIPNTIGYLLSVEGYISVGGCHRFTIVLSGSTIIVRIIIGRSAALTEARPQGLHNTYFHYLYKTLNMLLITFAK